MEDEEQKKLLLAALLDLRIAIGELQAAMTDVERCARGLMAVELEIKKGGAEPDGGPAPPLT